MRHEITGKLAVLALILSPAWVAAAMYKWVDENGHTHYTQEPPPAGVKGSEIRPQSGPADVESSQETAKKLQEEVDRRREAREKDAKTEGEAAAQQSEKSKRCDAAKQRFEKAQRPRTNFVEADGSQRRATEEERLEQIKQSEKQVKDFCG